MLNPEEAIIQFQDKEPEPGDYVLVEYAGKDKERDYIGFITQPKDEEDDFEVSSVLSVEHAILRSIDLPSIIRDIANRKFRKHDV